MLLRECRLSSSKLYCSIFNRVTQCVFASTANACRLPTYHCPIITVTYDFDWQRRKRMWPLVVLYMTYEVWEWLIQKIAVQYISHFSRMICTHRIGWPRFSEVSHDYV